MFESGEEPEVTTGLGIMNELVVPCIPLLLAHDTERDLLAVEDMRNRWCSYLGQEMECESLTEHKQTLPVKPFSLMFSRQCLKNQVITLSGVACSHMQQTRDSPS